MKKDDILVIKLTDTFSGVGPSEINMFCDYIKNQRKEYGVIVLPNWCEVIIAPGDVEIKVEGGTDGEDGQH